MQTDVVTGAFSYLGAAIARQLRTKGHHVRTLTGHPRRAPADTDIDVRPLAFPNPGPGPDPDPVAAANAVDALARDLTGAHTLYCTYWVRFSHGDVTHQAAVKNSRMLFDAAARAGVQRIVHVSITHADPASPYPYFRGKGEVEEHLKTVNVPYAIVRPAILFGGNGVLINNIAWLLRRLPVFAIGGRGDYRIRPIHVDDLARLAVHLGAQKENTTRDAVGPESLTFKEMVTAIRSATGSHAIIVPAPGWLIPPLSAALGVALRDVLLNAEEYQAMAAGLADSQGPATGQTVLTEWIARHGQELGRTYANELNRHYR
jgi:uncharacterized protein YbjT (DUF2867 family)